MSTPLLNQNAAGADIPAPLAIVVRRAGREYRQCFREGNIAIYLARGPGNRCEYEVGRVEVLAAGQVDGRNYPSRESFPPSAAWGKSAWTFTGNSHRDPLAAALGKARILIGEAARTGEQP